MKLSQLDYHLPKELIANQPATPRDSSKLLILDKNTGNIQHSVFHDLVNFLTKDDVLVFNETKVFPARIIGKKESGGAVEILLLQQKGHNQWMGMYRGKVSEGQKIIFPKLTGTIITKKDNSITLEFSKTGLELMKTIEKIGNTPIPPYIHTKLSEKELRSKYQTVYAKNKGSAAAPTAGFHFTKELIDKLKGKGIQMEYVTLHVGLGTFAPIKEDTVEKHPIHTEQFAISKETAERLNQAKKDGKRIIAVGTTTTRVLETSTDKKGAILPSHGLTDTDLFIYPPYKFKIVDGLITNFHLPKSTLLALVSAFTSEPNAKNQFESFEKSIVGKAYLEATEKMYRFYSFGDAMFLQ